jgi:hypothetical protein
MNTVTTSLSFPSLSFPSPAFPGVPPFTLDAPDGWTPATLTNALVALRDSSPRRFQPNLVLTCERFPADTTVASLAAEVNAERAERMVNYSATDIEVLAHEAGVATMFRSAFTIAVNGEALEVAQWTAFVDSATFDGVHYIAAITVSAERSEAADLDASIVETVASFRYC